MGYCQVSPRASHPSLHFTLAGVYFEPKCSSIKMDLAGYGYEGADLNKNKYWLVKNRHKLPKILLFEIQKGILV